MQGWGSAMANTVREKEIDSLMKMAVQSPKHLTFCVNLGLVCTKG